MADCPAPTEIKDEGRSRQLHVRAQQGNAILTQIGDQSSLEFHIQNSGIPRFPSSETTKREKPLALVQGQAGLPLKH